MVIFTWFAKTERVDRLSKANLTSLTMTETEMPDSGFHQPDLHRGVVKWSDISHKPRWSETAFLFLTTEKGTNQHILSLTLLPQTWMQWLPCSSHLRTTREKPKELYRISSDLTESLNQLPIFRLFMQIIINSYYHWVSCYLQLNAFLTDTSAILLFLKIQSL